MINLTELLHAISKECEEDRVNDDVTASLLDPKTSLTCQADLIVKSPGIFSGESIIQSFQILFEESLTLRSQVKEGQPLAGGDTILSLTGDARTCLSLERTLINYLSHLCGIATLTRKFVEAVQPHPTKILATRKTLPGLRALQLQAVVAGGGHIHRRNLSDGILIKENHQVFTPPLDLISAAKQKSSPLHKVEVEIQSLTELDNVLQSPPEILMLDNFSTPELRQAIAKIRNHSGGGNSRSLIEVSGGMTLEKVGEIAAMGVDYISVGRLTHSSPSLDMSMDFKREPSTK